MSERVEQTVYVVHWVDYDDVGNAGVYTTRERAEAAVEECKLNNPHLPYHIEELVIDAPADRPYPHFSVIKAKS